VSLHPSHEALLNVVNYATTHEDRRIAKLVLAAWRLGFCDARKYDDAKLGAMLIAADMHYLTQPEHAHRPMCGGVWLDWKPAAVGEVTP